MKQEIKKHIYSSKIYLISLCFFIPSTDASWLSSFLSYDPSQRTFWNSRVENVNDIEDYLYRNLFFDIDCLNDPEDENIWANFLSDRDSIESLNRISDDPRNRQALSQHEQNLQTDAETLLDTLNTLPAIELESYTVQPMPEKLWQNLKINDAYRHHGFMSGTASLHHAYDDIKARGLDQPKAIFKIQSKQGKLVNFLYQDDQSKMLWRPNSTFKVVQKDYHQGRRIYYVQLQEITHEEAQSMPRIVDSREGHIIREQPAIATCP